MRAGSDIERKLTATSSMQCVYSSVSKASLRKTGVLLNSAGDFREFSAEKVRTPVSGDFGRGSAIHSARTLEEKGFVKHRLLS